MGTTPNTIIIDGSLDDWESDEFFNATTPEYASWWFTWDENNFYFATNNSDIGDTSPTKWVVIYFDVDPFGNEGSNTGVTFESQTPTLGFKADYFFQHRTGSTNNRTWRSWSGTSWESFSVSYGAVANAHSVINTNDKTLEFRVRWNVIGSPNQIRIVAFVLNEQDKAEATFFIVPDTNTPGYNPPLPDSFGWTIANGVRPNIDTNFQSPPTPSPTPAPPTPSPTPSPPTTPSPEGQEDSFPIIPIAAGAGGGVLLLVLLLFLILCLRRSKKQDRSNSEIEMEKQKADESTNYSLIPKPHRTDSVSKIVPEGEVEWEIDLSDLEMGEKLGEGSYGEVFKGRYRKVDVAIKQIKASSYSQTRVEEFRRECALMKKIRPHPNLALLIGIVSTQQPFCIITEFYSKGSLESQLPNYPEAKRIPIILGVARGLYHLHKEKFVHRDISARNVLLSDDWIAKISDFGLTRIATTENSNESQKTESNIGPLKWMSPENLSDQVYSFKSDIWAFGILICEVYLRSEPYPGMAPINVATKVANGKLTHPIPENAETEIAQLLLDIFQLEPEHRPDASQIVERIEKL